MVDLYKVPNTMLERYLEIIALIDPVCEPLLNEEYADLARKMTATLARKRPSPLEKGTTRVWACSILYTLGRVNFMFDKDESPYVSADALSEAFDVSPRTAATKSNIIIDLLNIQAMDPIWTLPSRLENNPMVWMVQLKNGLVIDIRSAPRDLQEEAFRLGIIPYVPADKE